MFALLHLDVRRSECVERQHFTENKRKVLAATPVPHAAAAQHTNELCDNEAATRETTRKRTNDKNENNESG
jgi:hypothetical protein